MLQRLFARNAVPEDRVENAVEHGQAGEERDALRERSAVILERLERKQATARKREAEARQVAREDAERRAEAATEAAAEPRGEATAETAAPVEGAVETAPESMHTPETDHHAAETGMAVTAHDDYAGMSEETPEEPVTGMSEPAADGGNSAYFTDDAPLRNESDDMDRAHHDAAAHGPASYEVTDQDMADHGEPQQARFGYGQAEDTSAYHAPETPTDDGQASYGDHEQAADENAREAEAPQTVPDIHDDPEAYEQIRRKAEEAKARIAARLQKMQSEGDAPAGDVDSREEFGDETPPLSPDIDDN